MKNGSTIRLTAFFLLHLLLAQVLTVFLCAAGPLQAHTQHRHTQHSGHQETTHRCCTETTVQLIKADRLYTAAIREQATPAPFRLHAPAAFVLTLLNNRPVMRPVNTTPYFFYPPRAPGTRIAIQRFQI